MCNSVKVSQVPIAVSKGYALPEFCGRDTVVFAVSFSGNTEETLAAYDEAVARGCRVVVVSAGGELALRARRDEVAHVPVPEDVPGDLELAASAVPQHDR